MPTITNRPGVTPNPAPGGAGGTAGTTGTTGTTATTTAGDPASPAPAPSAPVPSAAGDLRPTPVKIEGFGCKPLPKVNIALVPQPGQLGTREARADAEDGGWVSRGYIDVKFAAAVGGVDITVESRHSKPSDPAKYQGDDMAIYLQARVLDEGKERIITLGTMFDGVMNPDGTSTGLRKFHVDYDEVNKWLKEKSPNLQLRPGDPLAAFAVWKGVGHQWGGFMREGYFSSPEPLGRQSAVAARRGPVAAPPAEVSTSDIVKPIDITHKVPEALAAQYPLVLEAEGKLVSRREHETKFCPKTLDELKAATLKLLDLAASDKRTLEKGLLAMFGKDEQLSKARGYPVSGWKLSTTDRYYAKDADGKVLKGADGLPIVVPMFDVYQDNPKPSGGGGRGETFPFARHNMAVRFRDGEIKAGENVGSMGKLNMKTPRVSDPFTLIQTGLELSLDTKPGISKSGDAMNQLAELLDKAPAPYNPLKEQKKVSYALQGSDVKVSAVDNLANRYKFALEHENGMEIEISMDFVHAGFVFENKVVEATKGLDEDKKFDHYAALLGAPDATVLCVSGPLKDKRGEINTVVFGVPKDDGTLDLTMANFWLDEQGNKRCSEHPAVRFPQVEMEMDHVQARSTGPVQSSYVQPTEVKNLDNDADQDAFLKGVTEKATMNGPPTTHQWEDLKDPKLYADSNYRDLGVAVTSFRAALFPDGVLPARQKAAQALELGGHIPKQKVSLSANMPWVSGRDVSVNVNWQERNKIEVKAGGGYSYGNNANDATKGTLGGKPTTLTIEWDAFPIKISFKGTETTKEVAEIIQQTLDKAVLHKAEVVQKDGAFTITVVDR
jgi:hypothetical protein